MALSYIDWDRNGILVLSLNGRLTLGEGTHLLRQLIDDALALGKKDIILNMSEVVYIDSTGLGELVARHKAVAQNGGKLKLAKLGSRAQALVQLTRLHTVFEIYNDEDSAVASFRV